MDEKQKLIEQKGSSFAILMLMRWFLAKNLSVANRTFLKRRQMGTTKYKNIFKWTSEKKNGFKNVYLVNAKPLGDAFTMIDMAAWQFHLLVTSSVCHLTNYTPVCNAIWLLVQSESRNYSPRLKPGKRRDKYHKSRIQKF